MMLTYLKQSWFFFRRNLYTIAVIQLPFIIVLNLLFTQIDLSNEAQNSGKLTDTLLSISLFNLVLMPIYWGATILFMQSTLTDNNLNSSQAIAASFKYWPKLFLIFTVSSLAIFAGFMAFIIPGIYIAVRLSLADYYCVAAKHSAISSLKLSWENTQDYLWPLLQGLAIIFLGSLATEMLIAQLITSIFGDNLYFQLPLNIAFDLLNVLLMIFAFRIFCLIEQENNIKSES